MILGATQSSWLVRSSLIFFQPSGCAWTSSGSMTVSWVSNLSSASIRRTGCAPPLRVPVVALLSGVGNTMTLGKTLEQEFQLVFIQSFIALTAEVMTDILVKLLAQ